MNSRVRTEDSAADICIECGSHCCKLGGVVATQNEVDAIIEQGYPNYFIRLSNDLYGLEWGENGTCKYLEQGTCTIYSVRPIGCRMFPVVQSQNNETILVECPLARHLSEVEVALRKNILIQRPDSIINAGLQLRVGHIRKLQMRATRFKYQKI